MNIKKKPYNSSRYSRIRMCFSSSATTSTRRCTTHTELRWCANTWTAAKILSICLGNANNRGCFGSKTSWRGWLSALSQLLATYSKWVFATEIWSRPISFYCQQLSRWRSLTLVNQKITSKKLMMAVWALWLQLEVLLSIWVQDFGRLMSKMVEIQGMLHIIYLSRMCFHVVWSFINVRQWKMWRVSTNATKSTMVRN